MDPAEIESCGLVAIIRQDKSEGVRDTARALVRGGVRALEITLNTPDALKHIAALRTEFGDAAYVGVGTVLSAGDARNAIDAGAQFVVTPTLQLDTIAHCRAGQTTLLCGCMTPSEALTAHQAGADYIKIFPATSLGLSYIRDILAPLPFLRLVPTGGINEQNITAFLQAGCTAVAVGSQLAGRDMVAAADWDGLAARAQNYVALVNAARADRR